MKTELSPLKITLLVTLCALCGGSGPVLVKIALTGLGEYTYLAIRFAAASLILYLFYKNETRSIWPPSKILLTTSLLAIANVTLFAYAIPYINASIGQMAYCTCPIQVLLLERFLLKTKISRSQFLGICLGFSGTFLLLFEPQQYQSNFWAPLLLITATICILSLIHI